MMVQVIMDPIGARALACPRRSASRGAAGSTCRRTTISGISQKFPGEHGNCCMQRLTLVGWGQGGGFIRTNAEEAEDAELA